MASLSGYTVATFNQTVRAAYLQGIKVRRRRFERTRATFAFTTSVNWPYFPPAGLHSHTLKPHLQLDF